MASEEDYFPVPEYISLFSDCLDSYAGVQIEIQDEIEIQPEFYPPYVISQSEDLFQLAEIDQNTESEEFEVPFLEDTYVSQDVASQNVEIEHSVFEDFVSRKEWMENYSHSFNSVEVPVEQRQDDQLRYIANSDKRRTRFLQGWKTLETKVSLMTARIGTTCRMEATLGNERFVVNRSREDSVSSSDTVKDVSDNETDDDHCYAAVILTQKIDSGTVSDHQYNQPTSSSTDSRSTKPLFLNNRYPRERRLVSLLTSIFTKIKALRLITGCELSLTVSYEEYIFTESNFEEAEAILRKKRQEMNRVSTVPLLTENADSPFSVIVDENSHRLTFIKRPSPIPDSPHTLPKLRRFEDIQDRCYDTIEDDNIDNDNPLPMSPHSPPEESQESSQCISSFTSTLTRDAENNTEPVCGICWSTIPPSTSNAIAGVNHWIRCFNPLCYHLVHPSCIGFRVSSSTDLSSLPPYFCQNHR